MDEQEKQDLQEENNEDLTEKSEQKSNDNVLIKMKNNGSLVKAVALIIMGLLFCICRTGLLNVLFTIVGVVLILLGGYDIYRKKYALGAIELIAGIIIIALGWTIANIAILILGIVIIVYAILNIIKSVDSLKAMDTMGKVKTLIKPIALIVFGILMITSFWVMADAMFIVIGVLQMLEGILIIVDEVISK